MATLIRAREMGKIYHRGQEQVEALRGVHLDIDRGSFVILMGPSGGGKSTLLHLLGGIDRPTSGTLTVRDFSLGNASESALTRFRRENVGFIFQFYNLLPSINALENAALPLLAQGRPRRQALALAEIVLRQVGLGDRLRHKPGQLSGGEQQRVAIARAIAGNPCLVLADEPTGDLDAAAAEMVMQLMRELNQSLQATFIVATHNPGLARPGDRLLELHNGVLQEK
jgi:putative ABC transport system ATP-binding protein